MYKDKNWSSCLFCRHSHILSGNIEFISLLLKVCAADGLPSICVHELLTGPINMYFSLMLYLPRYPNPTTHQSSEKNKQFIVAFKMDIFRDNCPSLRTQNNCSARTGTWVFSILASINLNLAYEIPSIFRYNINTKLTLQAYY